MVCPQRSALLFSIAAFTLAVNCTPEHGPAAVKPVPIVVKDTVSDAPVALELHPLRKDSSVLVFNNGDTLRTGLHKVTVLGQVTGRVGSTYVLLSGRHCDHCTAPLSLYVLKSSEGVAHTADSVRTWHVPGELGDGRTNEVFYSARVFLGEVLRDTIGIIWYEHTVLPNGITRDNTALLRLDTERPDTLIFFEQGRKSITLDLAFRGRCRELKAIDQKLVP